MALSDGLLGYWSAWQGASGYRLIDRVRANNGTLTNMDAGTDWIGANIFGRFGFGLDLDGSDDFVSAPLQATQFATPSINLWVYPTAMTSSQKGMFSWASTQNSSVPFLLVTQENPGSSTRVYVDADYRVSMSLVLNQWNMISICQEASLLWRFYLNGLQIGTYQDDATSQFKTTGTSIFFGSGFGGFFSGRFCEGAVWSRGISRPEILDLFRLGPGWYRAYARKRYAFVGAAFNRRRRILCGDYS